MTVVHNNFFSVTGQLKENLDTLDRMNIRTSFKQASDPVLLAFDYIDSKPLSKVVKEFASDTVGDFIEFVSKVFA